MAIYMWREWRAPGANTLAYRPLDSDLNDYSWNNHHFSIASWNVSYSDNMATLTRCICSWWWMNGFVWDFTMLMYTTNAWGDVWLFPICDSRGYPSLYVGYWWNVVWWGFVNLNNLIWYTVTYSYSGAWVHLVAFVKTDNAIIIYLDGVEVNRVSWTYTNMYNGSWTNNTWLGTNVIWTWTSTYWNIIIENKARTAQEISNYYNQTKWNYWI